MSQAGLAGSSGGGTLLETLTGNSGGAVPPTANNINTLGTGSITIVGSPGTSTLTTQLTGLTNHNVLVGAGTATITNVAPSTAGFVLTSNGAAADPSFQAVSASGAIITITGNSGGAESPTAGGNFNILGTGSITVAGSANTETVQLTGLTNHSLLVGAGTATITNLGIATNGQLPIGSTGADPVLATITAGTGISVTNGAGSITIAATSGGLTWTDVTGATQTLAAQNGYVTDRGGGVTYTLPASGTLGDQIVIVGKAGLATITPNANQQILIGSASGTVGATGTAVSNNAGDCITLICITAGASTVWRANSVVGTWTLN